MDKLQQQVSALEKQANSKTGQAAKLDAQQGEAAKLKASNEEVQRQNKMLAEQKKLLTTRDALIEDMLNKNMEQDRFTEDMHKRHEDIQALRAELLVEMRAKIEDLEKQKNELIREKKEGAKEVQQMVLRLEEHVHSKDREIAELRTAVHRLLEEKRRMETTQQKEQLSERDLEIAPMALRNEELHRRVDEHSTVSEQATKDDGPTSSSSKLVDRVVTDGVTAQKLPEAVALLGIEGDISFAQTGVIPEVEEQRPPYWRLPLTTPVSMDLHGPFPRDQVDLQFDPASLGTLSFSPLHVRNNSAADLLRNEIVPPFEFDGKYITQYLRLVHH